MGIDVDGSSLLTANVIVVILFLPTDGSGVTPAAEVICVLCPMVGSIGKANARYFEKPQLVINI